MITRICVLTIGHEARFITPKPCDGSNLPQYDAWVLFRVARETGDSSVTISIYLKYEFKMQNAISYYLF